MNLRIQAINWYLKRIEQEKLTLKSVKVQQKPFLEDVISEADYEFLKKQLLRAGDKYWYYVVRFMGATGARVSELHSYISRIARMNRDAGQLKYSYKGIYWK